MPPFSRTARDIIKVLPILFAIGGIAAAPVTAFASNQGPGGGERGGPPATRALSAGSLMRMNESALMELRYADAHPELHGAMKRFDVRTLADGLLDNPERTRNLIERLENVATDEQRKEIVKALLAFSKTQLSRTRDKLAPLYDQLVRQKRLGRKNIFGRPIYDSNDRGVQAYWELLDSEQRLLSFRALLAHMQNALDRPSHMVW